MYALVLAQDVDPAALEVRALAAHDAGREAVGNDVEEDVEPEGVACVGRAVRAAPPRHRADISHTVCAQQL